MDYYPTLIILCTTLLVFLNNTYENMGEIKETDEIAIGDEHGGGIVGYILQSGDPGYVSGEMRGLIVDTEDHGISEWGCLMHRVGTTSTELGTGMDNTVSIIAYHDENFKDYEGSRDECYYNDGTMAARVCHVLELNGYNDWYLPSKDELNILFDHRKRIGTFKDADYWSSSEGSGSWNVWFRRFYGSTNQGHGHKDMKHNVRCVRSF